MTCFTMRGISLVCLLGLWLTWGCSTLQTGVTNEAGTVVANLDSTPEKIAAATRDAVKDLNLALISAQADENDGLVEARTAQEVRVKIKMTAQGDKTSQVSIRVGTLGDEALSLRLLNRIKARLNSPR